MIRGFDKVDRRPYRNPILTYVTSRKFALKAIADPWVTAICLTEELYKDLDSHAFGGRTAILSDDPVSFFSALTMSWRRRRIFIGGIREDRK